MVIVKQVEQFGCVWRESTIPNLTLFGSWTNWTKIPNPTVFSDITHAKKALRDLLPMEAVLTESYMILT